MACGLSTWMGVRVRVYVGGLSTWQMDCLRGREPTVTGTAHTVFLCVSRAFPVRLAQCAPRDSVHPRSRNALEDGEPERKSRRTWRRHAVHVVLIRTHLGSSSPLRDFSLER